MTTNDKMSTLIYGGFALLLVSKLFRRRWPGMDERLSQTSWLLSVLMMCVGAVLLWNCWGNEEPCFSYSSRQKPLEFTSWSFLVLPVARRASRAPYCQRVIVPLCLCCDVILRKNSRQFLGGNPRTSFVTAARSMIRSASWIITI